MSNRTLLAECLRRMKDPSSEFHIYDWETHARDKQKTPKGDWHYWVVLAGRGAGKTRQGAEWIREKVESSNEPLRIALIGETAADIRDTMIEGPSGILATSPPWFKPTYNSSKRRVTWPNGCIATTFSAETPNQLRGPQFHYGWIDEPAKFRYLEETIDMFEFGHRLPFKDKTKSPQAIITGTPRPLPLLKQIIKEPTTHLTIGNTFENEANLDPFFLSRMRAKYEGTTLGRQELYAEILDNVEGALFQRKHIQLTSEIPQLSHIVVGIDPPGGATEAGIIAVGVDNLKWRGLTKLPKFYVLDDYSTDGSPTIWANKSIELFEAVEADRMVAEKNFGGDMVEHTLQTVDPTIPLTIVTASKSKQIRAEPIVSLYQQNRVYHTGAFTYLEDEMTQWIPDESTYSPNRLDALVWAMSYLLQKTKKPSKGISIS